MVSPKYHAVRFDATVFACLVIGALMAILTELSDASGRAYCYCIADISNISLLCSTAPSIILFQILRTKSWY
jgi:hypothetical protein